MQIEKWINEHPDIKPYINQAKELYSGPIKFVRVGKKKYNAKLDCEKLASCCPNATEASFEIYLSNKSGGRFKDFFYLRIVTERGINTIKLF